jgi:hypothetical protein
MSAGLLLVGGAVFTRFDVVDRRHQADTWVGHYRCWSTVRKPL